jgi:hypothetical protein
VTFSQPHSIYRELFNVPLVEDSVPINVFRTIKLARAPKLPRQSKGIEDIDLSIVVKVFAREAAG